MFTICVLISCANICVDTLIKDDGSIEIGEHRIVSYDKKCMAMLLSQENASN